MPVTLQHISFLRHPRPSRAESGTKSADTTPTIHQSI